MEENSLLENLKADYKAAETLKNDNDEKVQHWLDVYNSKPYGNEVKFKSQYVSSMVKQAVGWQLPSIVDPFTSDEGIIKTEPVTHLDIEAAEQAEKLLNFQFTRDFPRFQFMSDIAMKLLTEGTCFIKTSWEFEEREVTEIEEHQEPVPMDPVMQQAFQEEMMIAMQQAEAQGQDPAAVQQEFMSQLPMEWVQEEVTKMKTIRNRPTSEIAELSDVRVDPTCRGVIKNAQFIIHDFETDLSSLRKDGRYKNLDLLENELQRDESYIDRENVDSTFEFQDNARRRLIVHEYWGNYDVDEDGIAEPMVFAWVGNTMIREDENPLDDGTKPFVRAVYSRKPGYIYGEPIAALLEDKQRIDSVLHRGIFDDMKRANNGQRGYKKGFTDTKNQKRFEQGKDFEFNTAMSDVWEGKYTGINNSVFNVMQQNQMEGQSIVGIKNFDHGTGGNSLGSTAAAVNATTTSSAKREMQIIRGIAEDAIIPMLQIWLSYDAIFMDEEQVVRLTDDTFSRVKRDDLDGNMDIKMSVSTQESKAMKADRLAFLMQTMGNSMPPEQSNIIMADLMEINDMPQLAEAIKNMPPPQPSPEQQRIQELQVELLEAQVKNERAKARENEIDYELKSAKTQTELAKGRNLDSNSDITDLDFLMKDEGEDERKENDKRDFDRAGAAEDRQKNNIAKYETERMKSQEKARATNDKKV